MQAKKEVSEYNMVGEGTIMGGLLVVGKERVEYMHVEKDFGEAAPHEEVLAAAAKAAQSFKA